jgi:LysM repeat protein
VNPKPTTTTTTKGNGVATPTPIQTGMTGSCNKFYKVVDGDSCETIAKKADITLANFYAWNKGVGSSCKTLWLGYYVCTGVK